MLKLVFLLCFLFIISTTGHYFVTYLENPKNFFLLKNNVGFIHKYYKNSYTIVILDVESDSLTDIIDQISFWKQVLILAKKNIFLNYKVSINSTEAKLCVANYIMENFLFNMTTKILCFEVFVSLFKSRQILEEMFLRKTISYSNNHIFFNYNSYKSELKNLMDNIKLNRFGIKDYNFLNQHFRELKIKSDEVRNNTLSCRINYKDLHYSPLYTEKTLNLVTSSKKARIAVLLPTLSSTTIIDENPLIKHTIPSLAKTISIKEFNEFLITIYIAYDDNDILLNNEDSILAHKKRIIEIFGSSKTVLLKYMNFPVSKSVVFLWNSLFVDSYKDGNDYFVQLNDDTEISSSEWITKAFKYFDEGFNGIIGFNSEEWGCKLFTQTIVSRDHYLRNFGNFYPMLFHNAMSDIWITESYKNNSKCLLDYKTNNHFSKTRYKKCPFNRRLLKKLLLKFDTIF